MSEKKSFWDRINSEAMSKQQIYEALRTVRKDEFLDAEMQRLGFWDPSVVSDAQKSLKELIAQKEKLQEELIEMQKNLVGKENAQQRQKEAQEKRKRESRRKRTQRRKEREKERKRRQKKWEEKRKKATPS